MKDYKWKRKVERFFEIEIDWGLIIISILLSILIMSYAIMYHIVREGYYV